MAFAVTACSDEDVVATEGYGYLQLRVQKAATRALTEGNTLEHLSDARKLRLSLRYNGSIIELTANLYASSAAAAEYQLTSENVMLRSGRYQLLGYAIYGDYVSGDMADILQVVTVTEPTYIDVVRDELTTSLLHVSARRYGRFSAHVLRLEPTVTRAGAPIYSDLFTYTDIDSVQVVFERTVGGATYREDRRVKAWRNGNSDEPTFETDTIDLQEGSYRIAHFELYNKRRQFMYAQDVDIKFEVEHYRLAKTDMGVQLPTSQGTYDGIVLKQIWDAMDGKSWSFHDQEAYGGNFVFTMDDGSPRPLSAWVRQPGVTVGHNGRVIGLNLGAFNPMGMVPDAIGKLDALERLYLGEHTDDVYYTLEGVGDIHYSVSPYQLSKTMDVREHRMDIARERSLIRCLSSNPSPLMSQRQTAQLKAMKYAMSDYDRASVAPANRITGISEEIGQLTNLTELYISNTMITKLPKSMSKLTSLTDLELYNNPLTELDGEIFSGMSQLTLVNIERLYNLTEQQTLEALDKMCEYCPKVQLLYICHMGLTRLPSKLNRLADCRLLDVSFNKIQKLTSLRPMAPIQVILNHNLLTSLPADLFATDDIELFSCTDNRLEEFPAVLSNLGGLYAFETVDLSGNRMHGFQEGFKGIRTEKLLMTVNYMGRRPGEGGHGFMPQEFAATGSAINYLDLSYNNIDTIRNAAIRGLAGLQALDLSKNELRYLPTAFNTAVLPYLTGVDVSHNRFDGFPENILNVSTVQQLLISDQGYYRDEAETQWVRTMTQWPTYLHLHDALINLDASGNDFRTISTFPANVTTFNIKNNPNVRITVPQEIQYKMSRGLFQFLYDESQNVTFE